MMNRAKKPSKKEWWSTGQHQQETFITKPAKLLLRYKSPQAKQISMKWNFETFTIHPNNKRLALSSFVTISYSINQGSCCPGMSCKIICVLECSGMSWNWTNDLECPGICSANYASAVIFVDFWKFLSPI